MKFKVLINGVKGVATAVQFHAIALGFKWPNRESDLNYEYLSEHDYMYFDSAITLMFWQSEGSRHAFLCDTMHLEDFFGLTPEDVRVEPERVKCTLVANPGIKEGFCEDADLTQDQIDRIIAIMEES